MPSVVQVKSFLDATSGTLSAATTAGNCLAVLILSNANSNVTVTTTAVTLGGAAGNFTQLASVQAPWNATEGTAGYVALWADPNCAGGQTAVAITCPNGAFSSGSGSGFIVYELSGMALTSGTILDQSASSSSGPGSTAVTSGSTPTTTGTTDVVIGGISAFFHLNAGYGSGYTTQGLVEAGSTYDAGGYQVASGAGSFSFTATQSSSGNWAALVAALAPLAMHSGAAALSGTGTLGGAGVFAAAAALSGLGTLGGTPTHLTSHGHGTATLDGNGTLGGAGTGIFLQADALSGSGTLAATWIGTLVQPPATLAGAGTLQLSGVKLGFTAALSGNGTLSILQATGGLVFASPGAAVPYAYPLSSQVMVAPPGTSSWTPLGSLGVVTALTYSFTCPGGADQMTATLMVPASYRNQYLNPGWQVRITRGGHQVWSGKLDEGVPGGGGWTLTASGAANRGQDYLAIYTDTWPRSQPDQSINNAISRGMPWVNPGVGTPSGAWFGQAVDSGAQTISGLLTLICTRGGLTWLVSSQPGGTPGDDLTVFPLPAVPNRLLVSTTPVPRTLGGDINTIWLRYEATADGTDASGNSLPATFAVTTAQNAQSVTAHGVIETYIDISDVGVMTAGAAQAVGNQVLAVYQRASFAGSFAARYGQLTNTGGVPIDPGTDQAGTCVRLILTDYGYGGEVTPQFPVTFIVGAYAWDDLAQTATITAYQSVDASLTGLLSLANTELTPITVASA